MKNPTLNSVDVGSKLEIHQTNALKHIKRLGFVLKLSVWVPHKRSVKKLINRIAVCSSNLARRKKEPFLNSLVTIDAKWTVNKNMVRKKSMFIEKNSAVYFKSSCAPEEGYAVLLVGPQGYSVL